MIAEADGAEKRYVPAAPSAAVPQTELARHSGVRLETIGRIESGEHVPRRETLLKLDRAVAGK